VEDLPSLSRNYLAGHDVGLVLKEEPMCGYNSGQLLQAAPGDLRVY